jgi:hypothetical protein
MVPPTSPITKQVKDEAEALVLPQDAKKDAKKTTSSSTVADDTLLSKHSVQEHTNVCCRSCGKLGHTLAVCPKGKPLMQMHALSADTDDASVVSDASSVIILAQNADRSSINPNFLLLGRQSTMIFFSNPHHVNNVRPVNCPISVHCNKGVITTNTVTNFEAHRVYLEEVKEGGIANILSLYLLAQKHHITYDSCNCGGVFKVHTFNVLLEFNPTSKGLHVLDLRNTPEEAHLLISYSQPSTTDYLHVNTVH